MSQELFFEGIRQVFIKRTLELTAEDHSQEDVLRAVKSFNQMTHDELASFINVQCFPDVITEIAVQTVIASEQLPF